MSIHNLCHTLPFMADNLFDDLVGNTCDRQHGDAGVSGAMWCVFHVQDLNERHPVRIIIISIEEMLTVRSAQEILTIVETIPIFKEWENLVRDRNGADSGSSFRGDYFEISFLKIDILFLEVEEFADSASGIYQHENDSIIYISVLDIP